MMLAFRVAAYALIAIFIALTILILLLSLRIRSGSVQRFRRLVPAGVAALLAVLSVTFADVPIRVWNRHAMYSYVTTFDLRTDLQGIFQEPIATGVNRYNLLLISILGEGVEKPFRILDPGHRSDQDHIYYDYRMLRTAHFFVTNDIHPPVLYWASVPVGGRLPYDAAAIPDTLVPGVTIVAWVQFCIDEDADARTGGRSAWRIVCYDVIDHYDIARTLATQEPDVKAEIDAWFVMIEPV